VYLTLALDLSLALGLDLALGTGLGFGRGADLALRGSTSRLDLGIVVDVALRCSTSQALIKVDDATSFNVSVCMMCTARGQMWKQPDQSQNMHGV
jgi:hypothetical protein